MNISKNVNKNREGCTKSQGNLPRTSGPNYYHMSDTIIEMSLVNYPVTAKPTKETSLCYYVLLCFFISPPFLYYSLCSPLSSLLLLSLILRQSICLIDFLLLTTSNSTPDSRSIIQEHVSQ